jgi:hypothetical protein
MVKDQAMAALLALGVGRTSAEFTKWPEENHGSCELMDSCNLDLDNHSSEDEDIV